MCLESVDKVTNKGKGYGYKVFRVDRDGDLVGWLTSIRGKIPPEEWIKAQPIRKNSIIYYPRNYEPNFHIFISKRSAEQYASNGGSPNSKKIMKVEYKEATASGKTEYFGHLFQTVVARKMFICKE